MFVGSSALLSKSNPPSVITLDNTNLTISSKSTLLGVTSDSNLNFSHFVSRTIHTSKSHYRPSHRYINFRPNLLLLLSQSHYSSQDWTIAIPFFVFFQPMFFLSCNPFKIMPPNCSSGRLFQFFSRLP